MTFQLPDERSWVRYLLDYIITAGAPLLAAIANLGLEDKGMNDDFEKTDSHLLMNDLVTKRKITSGPSNRDQPTHVSKATASISTYASDEVSKGKIVWILGSTRANSLWIYRKNKGMS